MKKKYIPFRRMPAPTKAKAKKGECRKDRVEEA